MPTQLAIFFTPQVTNKALEDEMARLRLQLQQQLEQPCQVCGSVPQVVPSTNDVGDEGSEEGRDEGDAGTEVTTGGVEGPLGSNASDKRGGSNRRRKVPRHPPPPGTPPSTPNPEVTVQGSNCLESNQTDGDGGGSAAFVSASAGIGLEFEAGTYQPQAQRYRLTCEVLLGGVPCSCSFAKRREKGNVPPALKYNYLLSLLGLCFCSRITFLTAALSLADYNHVTYVLLARCHSNC